MTQPEQFANDAETVLAAPIDAHQTVISVRDPSRFPKAAQFRVLVDHEIMIVIDGAGTSSWRVVRGAEDTKPASHSHSLVSHIITAGALGRLRHPWVSVADYGGDLHATLRAGAGGRIVIPAGTHAFERTLAVPPDTHVELLPGAILECRVTDGGPGITIANGSKLSANSSGSMASRVLAATGCRIDSLITNAAHDATQEFGYIEGLCILVQERASIATALVNFVSLFVNSGIRDCVIVGGYTAPVGIRIAGGKKSGFGPVYIENTWVNTCTKHNIIITEENPSTGSAVCWLTNVTSENQGDGYDALHIKGYGGLYDIQVRGFHYEHGSAVKRATTAIFVDGCPGFVADGVDVIGLPPANKKGVVISKSGLNYRVQVRNVHNVNAIAPILEDQLTGVTLGGRHVGFYETANPGRSVGETDQMFVHLVRMPGGVATMTRVGAPSDADFPTAPPDGTLAVDTAKSRLYVRVNGSWKSVALS